MREVASGIHRVQRAGVNVYLIEDDDGITLVDAGLPAFWQRLGEAIRALGRRPRDIRALVLTHAHFDHVGVARKLQRRLGIPVWAHPAEHYLAAHPYRYAHENPRAIYPIRHPAAIPILSSMAAAGALWVRGVDDVRPFEAGAELDVPGRPRVVATPGHTLGHVALHLPDRDTVLSGDALVTLDPYTARTGPRIVAGAANADHAEALRSLEALARTGASTVLPGHGEPWTDGVEKAADLALTAGPS